MTDTRRCRDDIAQQTNIRDVLMTLTLPIRNGSAGASLRVEKRSDCGAMVLPKPL